MLINLSELGKVVAELASDNLKSPVQSLDLTEVERRVIDRPEELINLGFSEGGFHLADSINGI